VPTMVGMGTIIQIPVGFSGSGYLPPRKAAIEGAMATMRPFIELSKKDVDAFLTGHRQLDLTDNTREEMKPLSEVWVKSIIDAYGQLKSLDGLTSGSHYDNQSIATAAANIDQDMKDLDKALRQFYKLLQKEGRAAQRKQKSV
jgi:hypothetical protein